jgi:hypothetical protein
LQRSKTNLAWPAAAPPELEPVAEQIWRFIAGGPATISALFQHCSVCELKICQVVDELIQSHHLVWSRIAADEKVA